MERGGRPQPAVAMAVARTHRDADPCPAKIRGRIDMRHTRARESLTLRFHLEPLLYFQWRLSVKTGVTTNNHRLAPPHALEQLARGVEIADRAVGVVLDPLSTLSLIIVVLEHDDVGRVPSRLHALAKMRMAACVHLVGVRPLTSMVL